MKNENEKKENCQDTKTGKAVSKELNFFNVRLNVRFDFRPEGFFLFSLWKRFSILERGQQLPAKT